MAFKPLPLNRLLLTTGLSMGSLGQAQASPAAPLSAKRPASLGGQACQTYG